MTASVDTDDSSNWDDLNIWRNHLVCRAAAPSQKYCLDPSACPWLTIVLAIKWTLHGFTNLPPPTSSSTKSLLSSEQAETLPSLGCSFLAVYKAVWPRSQAIQTCHEIVGMVGGLLLQQHSCDEDHMQKRSWRCGFIRFPVNLILSDFYRSLAGTKGDLKHL